MSESLKILRVALAGNPNAGKTSLFNALTGAHHKVGNYPGVTVEKREGSRTRNGIEYRFIDLPGIYSLTAYSIDEVVTRDFLLDEAPDVIVDVLDSTNLERNLYLCLQFQELGIPIAGALNMSDEASAKGIAVDAATLSAVLGIPMAKTVGTRGEGIDELLNMIDETVLRNSRADNPKSVRYGSEIEAVLEPIETAILADGTFAKRFPPRWLAVKLLEKDAHAEEILSGHKNAGTIGVAAREAIAWTEKHYGKDAEIVVSEQRYGYIRGAARESVRVLKKHDFSLTEAIDKVVMNQFLALPIFAAVLWSVFKLTFTLGAYPMGWLETVFTWLSGLGNSAIPEGFIRSLVVDGILGGVGGVFSFIPLIVILFFLLAILEDIGYMSRAAFATDKILHAFGLHGQSVFPMMLGFGCSVPAIMAARTLKSRRDRIVTILIIPFMSCGAKLPVHVLLAAAFFPDRAAEMVMLIYAIGVALSLACAWMLKKTALRGDATPFVMELPPFRAPTLKGILWHVWAKTWFYLKKAGTTILAATIFIWAITTFPVYDALPLDPAAAAGARLEHSIAGRMGKFIEPAFKPLGFDWKIAVASVTGFAAKEIVVSTLGILYRVGVDGSEGSESLRNALRSDPNLSPLVAFSLMLFTLVIPPCFAALATIKSEIGWKWLGFSICLMLGIGWSLGALVYQGGKLLGLG